ncbi:MAG: thiol:disulfide interchange protein DsbA/DsbL [Proteobacteria bacterium]|nr:thiol:disulfide interchange protein DsbA/DsbL [Pseudomonadota bacterium]
MIRGRIFPLVASVLLAWLAGSAWAELKEGQDFTLIAPQPTEAVGKIEVTEFFWYGCPHCYELEPVLNQWVKSLPGDVAFRRIPAIFLDARWTPGARLYYTLEALGEESRLRSELFAAIHVGRMNYTNEAEVGEWLAKKGVERGRFAAAYNSATVQGKINRAQELTQAHAIKGVPAVVVGGKYFTSNNMADSNEALPGIIDELIRKARADLGKPK